MNMKDDGGYRSMELSVFFQADDILAVATVNNVIPSTNPADPIPFKRATSRLVLR